MKIALALREAHDAETELGGELLRVGDRHRADHDVFHLTRTLARWSDRHVRLLAEQAGRYGVDLDADAGAEDGREGLLSRLREKGSELAGRRPEPGLLLLRDLRDLHLAAARASLAWTVLGQGAQAVRDAELLDAVTAPRDHPHHEVDGPEAQGSKPAGARELSGAAPKNASGDSRSIGRIGRPQAIGDDSAIPAPS